MPSNITATPFLYNTPQLSMSNFVLYITEKSNPRPNSDPSKHKILQNEQRKLDEQGINNSI